MKDEIEDQKQKAILEAAWTAFATYGFRKTSMDDIARGAGMSRAAVYLHFRNKEDIFRRLAIYCYDMSIEAVKTALEHDGSITETLARAFQAQGDGIVEPMLTSPHGMELLDASGATASDIIEDGERQLRQIYAEWLDRQAEAGRIHLSGSAEGISGTMMAGLKGIKVTAGTYPVYKEQVALAARLFGDGLTRSN
ncbi:MAG: helix-turn-helix domain-containing protein [Pseudomonadota bacterium]